MATRFSFLKTVNALFQMILIDSDSDSDTGFVGVVVIEFVAHWLFEMSVGCFSEKH